MARRKRQGNVDEITPAQAHYVLGKLVVDGRVSAAEVNGYVRGMEAEIRELESRLSALKSSYAASGNGRQRTAPAIPVRRQRQLSPEQRASRQLQGQYMSLIRQFPAEKRGAFKQISQSEGREAAIRKMRAELA